MWSLLSSINPMLLGSLSILLLMSVVLLWWRFKVARLEKTIAYQHEMIRHQENTIVALEEDVKNAKLKRKYEQTTRGMSDSAVTERMQHEGFYRD